MPLSPKKVYKKPYIEGACSYAGQLSAGEPVPDGMTLACPDDHGTGTDSEEAINFWPEPFEDGINDGLPEKSGLEVAGSSADSPASPNVGVSEAAAAANAKKKAEAALEKKANERLRESYEQGKAKAEDECRSMKKNAEAKLREAELSLREARHKSKEIVASSERKIVELATAVAERLIHSQLEATPETIVNIARETLNLLDGGEQIELYVNSADLPTCRDYSSQLKQEFREIVKLEVFSDDTIPRGSCRVESECGVAEYLIDKEKEQLKETLLKIARKEESDQLEEEEAAYGRH